MHNKVFFSSLVVITINNIKDINYLTSSYRLSRNESEGESERATNET